MKLHIHTFNNLVISLRLSNAKQTIGTILTIALENTNRHYVSVSKIIEVFLLDSLVTLGFIVTLRTFTKGGIFYEEKAGSKPCINEFIFSLRWHRVGYPGHAHNYE